MSRSSTSLVLVVVALLTAPLAGAATGASTDSGPSKQAIRALTLRGQALDRVYHLGAYADPSPQAIRALTLRGQALDRTYHLGAYADPSKQAIRALALRGQGLDRTYHLGAYADPSGSSFPWRTVAFVAAATLGVMLLAFAGTVGVRKRRAVIAV